MKSLKVAIGVCMLALISVAHAEEIAIFEAGTKIAIGMSKSGILECLKKNYNLVTLPEIKEDMWFIQTRDTNYSILQLGFEDNLLSFASHDWKNYDEQSSAYSLGSSLILLITNLIGDNSRIVTIKTNTLTKRGAEQTIEELEITFPQRSIEMRTSRGPNYSYVQIRETIFK